MERGRKEKLTDEIKQFIAAQKQSHPKQTAKDIMSSVRLYLINKEKEIDPDLNDKDALIKIQLHDKMPGLSAITKYLTPVTKRIQGPDEEMEQWHLGLMNNPKYAIPAEAIPYVLKIQKLRPNDNLSIRVVKWIGRIYITIKKPEDLESMAMRYSWLEHLSEISDVELNTTHLDILLRNGKFNIDQWDFSSIIKKTINPNTLNKGFVKERKVNK